MVADLLQQVGLVPQQLAEPRPVVPLRAPLGQLARVESAGLLVLHYEDARSHCAAHEREESTRVSSESGGSARVKNIPAFERGLRRTAVAQPIVRELVRIIEGTPGNVEHRRLQCPSLAAVVASAAP